MLSDLTFVMCVPSFRCNAAHRMHRNIPNCLSISNRGSITISTSHSRSSLPNLQVMVNIISIYKTTDNRSRHTWISRLTICANIVPWYRLYQFLKGPLVARLLALAQSPGHVKEVSSCDYSENAMLRKGMCFDIFTASNNAWKNRIGVHGDRPVVNS